MSSLANLDLSSALEAAKVVCTVEILGALEPDDLAAALQRGEAEEATKASIPAVAAEDDPKDLKKLRAKHHSVARLIASGMQQRMVAQLSGYTESYLSVLLAAPAMQDLVQTYQTLQGSKHDILAERLRKIGDDALDEIEARLDDPEARKAMDINELLSVAKTGLDRSGHGPQSKHHLVAETHLFDHAELRKRDELARNASRERIIDITPALPAPDSDGDD